jgi:hypothetical protein
MTLAEVKVEIASARARPAAKTKNAMRYLAERNLRSVVADVRILIQSSALTGEGVSPDKSAALLHHEKDRPFIGAAIFSSCCVVTGKVRHFPHKLGV